MDAESFLDDLRDENETALSRIGSSKMLYALTGGEMEADPIATAVATDAEHARSTFTTWADDEEHPDAAELFNQAAQSAADVADGAGAEPDDTVRPIYDYLLDLEDTRARLAGLVGASLVSLKITEQIVGFYVGDADPSTASTYRGVKSDYENQRDAAAELLASVCEDEDDWEAASEVATEAIQTTYDFYVETLESMGIKPKNVC